jgi:hypothetical protein
MNSNLKLNNNIVEDCISRYNSNEQNTIIIFSKCCGYHFSHFFLNNMVLKDLYYVVNLYYENVNNIKLYYINQDSNKVELPMTENKIKTFFIRNSKPSLPYPGQIVYQVIIGGLCDNDSC